MNSPFCVFVAFLRRWWNACEQLVDVCTGRFATCSELYVLPEVNGTIPPEISKMTSLKYMLLVVTAFVSCGVCRCDVTQAIIQAMSCFCFVVYLTHSFVDFVLRSALLSYTSVVVCLAVLALERV